MNAGDEHITRFANAFDEARVALLRRAARVRVLAVAGFTLVHLVLGYALDRHNWRGNLSLWLGYLAIALAVWVLGQRSRRFALRSGAVIPLADMPLIFAVQLALLPNTDDPTVVVGFTIGPYIMLVMWSALTLDRRLVFTSALVGAALQSVLFIEIGSDAGGPVVSAVLMVSAAAIAVTATARLVGLVRAVTREEARGDYLEQLAREKDHFVATVSHDFRSPLAVVLAAVQTVESDPDMPADKRSEILARAVRQCRRLTAMVGDLLELARMRKGRDRPPPLDVGEVVDELVAGLRPVFEEASLTLTYAAAGSPVRACVDRGHLERAVSNLLDNARKFTPEGGRVTVELGGAAGEATLSVRDTGCGIAAEDQARLFEPFFQAAAGAARSDGSGLGLAIVAEIARRYGGGVRVDSRLNAGSTLSVVLPLAPLD